LQGFGDYFSGVGIASCGKLVLNKLLLFGLEGDRHRLVDAIIILIISLSLMLGLVNIRRCIAFPRQFLNSHVPLIWECFAQYLTTQGQENGESEEGFASANGDVCGALCQKTTIFSFYLFTFALEECRTFDDHHQSH